MKQETEAIETEGTADSVINTGRHYDATSIAKPTVVSDLIDEKMHLANAFHSS